MEESASSFNPSELTYDDRGLIPAVLQQKGSGKVIMLGYMSEETLNETIRIGQAVFWSRSRQEIWHKGATSGDYVNVHSISTDCDRDVVLLEVSLEGSGVCHTGSYSCFVTEEGDIRQVVESSN